MTLHQFGNEDFANLFGIEFAANSWEMLGVEHLGDDHPLVSLVAAVQDEFIKPEPDAEIDWDALLLIKTDAGGLVDRIYAPSIFKDDAGNIILKIGNNSFNVQAGTFAVTNHAGKQFNETGLLCSRLIAEIDWSEKISEFNVKRNGEEIAVEYHGAWVDLVDYGQENPTYYRAKISWTTDLEVTKSMVKTALKTGESIVPYLRLAPVSGGGGGSTLKLQELIADADGKLLVDLPCKLPVQSVKLIDGKFGESYVLVLEDGREVWARGKASAQLATGFQVKPGCKLSVSSCAKKDGKWMINCALLAAPKPPAEAKAVAAAKPTAKPAAAAVASASPDEELF